IEIRARLMKKMLFTISAILWVMCISLIVLGWLEYFGGYDLIKKMGKRDKIHFLLFRTKYYGRPLDEKPYAPFHVQHLHPFYLFALPWTVKEIAKANSLNSIISLNQLGFRNSFQNSAQRKGVILGGSAAFGAGASGDQTTIASALNKIQGDYDFLNY